MSAPLSNHAAYEQRFDAALVHLSRGELAYCQAICNELLEKPDLSPKLRGGCHMCLSLNKDTMTAAYVVSSPSRKKEQGADRHLGKAVLPGGAFPCGAGHDLLSIGD